MARTADVFNEDTKGQPLGSMALPIVSAAVAFEGSYLAGGIAEHGTAANRGRLYPFNDETGAVPLGFCHQGGTGNSGGTVFGAFDPRGGMRKVLVTGATAQATDFLKYVYATDDGTFTLTRPTLGVPIGVVWEFVSGTTCWVYFLGFEAMLVMQSAGNGAQSMYIGTVTAGATAGNVATGIVMPHRGRITSVYGVVIQPGTDVDYDMDVNFEIDAVDVTGGVIDWKFSDALGVKKSGTAVTGTNKFQEGSLIDLEATIQTAGTAADPGKLAVYMNYIREPGL
jgi:hypothetical protein